MVRTSPRSGTFVRRDRLRRSAVPRPAPGAPRSWRRLTRTEPSSGDPAFDLEPRRHQALPATKRSTPARSRALSTASKPGRHRGAATAVAWRRRAVSRTSTPDGTQRRRGAAAAILRITREAVAAAVERPAIGS